MSYTYSENTEQIPAESWGITDVITTPILTIAHILDTPGGMLRDTLAGKDISSILSDVIHPSERASGRDVLTNLGLDSETGKLGSFDLASLVTEIGLDPLLPLYSMFGLTKAGKAAKELSEATKSVETTGQIMKNLATRYADMRTPIQKIAESAPDIYDVFKSAGKRKADLIAQGVKELAPTIREQIAAGQRGLAFAIPFVSGEFVPKSVNELLSTPISLANQGWDEVAKGAEILTKPLKSAFSTAKDTEVGQFVADQGKFAKTEVDQKISATRKFIDDKLNEWAKDAEIPREELDLKFTKAGQAGSPETINKYYDAKIDLIDMTQSGRITEATEKYISRKTNAEQAISDLVGIQKLDADAAPAAIEEFTKKYGISLDKSIPEHLSDYSQSLNKIQKDWETRVKQIKTFKENKIRGYEKDRADLLSKVSREAGFVGVQGDLPFKLLEEIRTGLQQDLDLMKSNSIAIDYLNDFKQKFWPHIATPEGFRFFRTNPEAESLFRDITNSRMPNSKTRKYIGMGVEDFNQLMKDTFKIDFDVFSTDPAYVISEYKRRVLTSISNARLTDAAIQMTATSTASEGAMHIADVLSNAGINGFLPKGAKKPLNWAIGTSAEDVRKLLKENGVLDVWVPKEIVKDLGIKQTEFSIGDLENVFRLIDPLNAIYRSMLTSVPAHVGTNLVGNLWSNSLVGLLPFTPSGIKTYIRAGDLMIRDYFERNPNSLAKRWFKFLDRGPLTDAEKKLLDHYEVFGGGNRNRISEISSLIQSDKKGALTKFFMGDQVDPELNWAVRKGSGFFKASKEFNNFVEETSKFAHFLHQTDRGMDVLEAGKSVKKYLFDYTDLTAFEKKVMRRAVLFYTFTRKNLPLAVQETLLNRQAYLMAKVPMATSRTEDFVPDYIKNQGNINLGPGHYIDLKNPLFEANNMSAQGRGIQGVVDAVAQRLAPQYKVPLELLSGREFFRGVPLEQVNKLPDRTLFGLLPSEILPSAQKIQTKRGTEVRGAPWLAEALRNVPWSRYEQIATDVADADIHPITSTLGLRERQIDPAKLKLQKTIQNIKQSLAADPSVREFGRYFSIEATPSARVKNAIEQLKRANEAYYMPG